MEASEAFLEDGAVQAACSALALLASESRIRTSHISLATDPAAIAAMTPLIDEGKFDEANGVNERFWPDPHMVDRCKTERTSGQTGQPPDIVHIMWDDNGVGEFGNELFNKIRGYSTPNINSLAEQGMTFARMCTEPSCTPSRAAARAGFA